MNDDDDDYDDIVLERPATVFKLWGVSKSTYYQSVKSGLRPPFIETGKNTRALPQADRIRVQRAEISGADEPARRAIVKRIIAARKSLGLSLGVPTASKPTASKPRRK